MTLIIANNVRYSQMSSAIDIVTVVIPTKWTTNVFGIFLRFGTFPSLCFPSTQNSSSKASKIYLINMNFIRFAI